MSYSANPVFVPAGGTMNVDVTISPDPALPNRCLYDGYVTAIPDDGGSEVRVPYMGFKGDYQGFQVMVPTANGFPWLAKLSGTTFTNQPSGATYTMQGQDVPQILYHFDHPAEIVRMTVLDAATGQNWHRALDTRYFPRNSGASSFFATGWDGTTAHGQHPLTVPNGVYVIQLTMKKALGDDNNPAHWESWTSPAITIARPDLLVESMGVSQSVVNAGDEVTVSASIRNDGAESAAGVTVTITDNDVAIHSETIDLAGRQSRTIQAPWIVSSEAQHRLRVSVSRLEDEVDFANNVSELTVELGQAIVGVGGIPRILALAPAMPNPSGSDVNFRFSLPEAGPVSLAVFDLMGRRVRSWTWSALPAGEHGVRWDGRTDAGSRASAGTVILRLTAMGKTLTRKAVRLE